LKTPPSTQSGATRIDDDRPPAMRAICLDGPK
jgi:hypothetical protein